MRRNVAGCFPPNLLYPRESALVARECLFGICKADLVGALKEKGFRRPMPLGAEACKAAGRA